MNLANLISILRIAFLPFIILLIYRETILASLLALFFLILALISDIADGYVARMRKEVTKVGSFLDPFADKILITGLLFIFVIRGSFWWIPLIIFLFRDVFVGIIRYLASRDDVQIKEEKYLKAMSYSLFGLIFFLLLKELFISLSFFQFLILPEWLVIFLTIAVLIMAIFSIFHHSKVYSQGLHSRKLRGKVVEKEKMIVLANKKASGYLDAYRRRLLRVFARRRRTKIKYLPLKPEMYEDIKLNNTDHILIAGGDGSFESALNYKPFQKKSLGFFPFGAGNAFYAYFYKGKRFEYLRSRFQFRETELDVLELEWDGQRRETLFVDIGFNAEVARTKKRGFIGYTKLGLKLAFVTKPIYNLVCRAGRKKIKLNNCMNLTLAKIPYHGYAVRSLLGKVHPNDGVVYGLATVNNHGPWFYTTSRIAGFILAALNLNRAPLLPLKGKEFVVESDQEFPLQAGGEFMGFTKKISVRVIRKQKVLVI